MNPTIAEAIERAAAVLRDASSIAITGHVNPDGDALGSALALALAARNEGREAVVAFAPPSEIPSTFDYLDLGPLVDPEAFPETPEVMVVFDVASGDRLGSLAASASDAGTLIVVDHHATNDGFGDIAVIDPTAAASAQLAYYLIREIGWPIDGAVASALHTGLVTDTGRFQYSATDGETLRVAGDLLDAGVRPEVIGQAVYESVPFGYLSVSSAVLGRAQLEPELGLVWSVVLRSDLDQAGVGHADIDGLIDDLRIAREAGVAALLKEVDEGFKVSLRSRGAVDVGALAATHGGGGHHNAAGFTMAGSAGAVIDQIRDGLR